MADAITKTEVTESCCSGAPSDGSNLSAKDPVCGMTVDPEKTAHHAASEGHEYHFCSAGCRTKFIADPMRYLSDAPRPATLTALDTIWTCPMHSQIRQPGPGVCPICGMALEPEEPSLDDVSNPQLLDFTRHWWVSAVLSVPLLVLTMGADLFGLRLVSPVISPWLQLALAAPILLWAARHFSCVAGRRSGRAISTCSR